MTERPAASSEHARRRMQRQARRDTGIELALRRELWGRGLRYRVERSIVIKRRRHDIVFIGARVVVDIRGCFWHSCPLHGSMPKSNSDWWRTKLEANRQRDADTESRLREAGWEIVVVWEHDDVSEVADRIEALVRDRAR